MERCLFFSSFSGEWSETGELCGAREREPVAELNPKLCEGRIAFGAAREAVDGLSKLLRLVPRIYGQANSNVKECA